VSIKERMSLEAFVKEEENSRDRSGCGLRGSKNFSSSHGRDGNDGEERYFNALFSIIERNCSANEKKENPTLNRKQASKKNEIFRFSLNLICTKLC
jgi:hypothetical protein